MIVQQGFNIHETVPLKLLMAVHYTVCLTNERWLWILDAISNIQTLLQGTSKYNNRIYLPSQKKPWQ